jgi:hypothetical protein
MDTYRPGLWLRRTSNCLKVYIYASSLGHIQLYVRYVKAHKDPQIKLLFWQELALEYSEEPAYMHNEKII